MVGAEGVGVDVMGAVQVSGSRLDEDGGAQRLRLAQEPFRLHVDHRDQVVGVHQQHASDVRASNPSVQAYDPEGLCGDPGSPSGRTPPPDRTRAVPGRA